MRIPKHAARVPGGPTIIGTSAPQILDDGEGPVRTVQVTPFRIGAIAVTNAEFARFIKETGFVTEAERFGWSFVFWAQVPEGHGATEGVLEVEWWRKVEGAYWAAPNGPGTEDDCRADHPVVHVSWNDARAYCDWVGGRLPTEAEWEHAARGGLGDVRFPWGDDEPNDQNFTPCNIWQGNFPEVNTCQDGYRTTAPARSYEPNAFGLYNMAGNVWEWTSEPYRIRSLKRHVKERLRAMKGYKLSKGGSFLCHRSYCYRYRIAARSGTSPDSTTTHHGFRVVWDD
ncbi:formylglycine-generating enzyme family protein [Sulfitobacter mediterraneus]|uniref:formylglycine-generating enzyme family protein n=1 Tax=Sulfitobacter mediterraneus TaxID=83219 RepID=UPI0021A8C05D|nr:formylglycine-generating enzyme family protein [Sulfitobacter mediterraneus]